MPIWVRNLLRMWMLALPFWCLWRIHDSRVLHREQLTTGDWLSFWTTLIVPPVVAFGLGYGLARAVEGFIASRRTP